MAEEFPIFPKLTCTYLTINKNYIFLNDFETPTNILIANNISLYRYSLVCVF